MTTYVLITCLAIVFAIGLSIGILIIRRWLIKKKREEKQRGAFPFDDGLSVRLIDPIATYRFLDNHDKYIPERHNKAAWAGDMEAMAICVDVARQAFGVQPFTSNDKPGLTDLETLDLLFSFFEWIEDVKKNITNSSKSPPSSEQTTTGPQDFSK